MNKANKITMVRIFISILIMIILLFPFYQLGVVIPTFLVKGKVLVDIRYVIVGVLFVIASITDFLDGYVARKDNMVTDFGKTMDAISDKLLTNPLLIILACNSMIHPVIPVVIIARDIVVDSLKMVMGKSGEAVGAIYVAKCKTVILMIGIGLTLFYNLPFELWNLRISDFLLVIACVLSVISGVRYYKMAKPYFKVK